MPGVNTIPNITPNNVSNQQSGLLQSLRPGQSVTVEVVSSQPGLLTVKTPDGQTLSAEFPGATVMAPGDKLELTLLSGTQNEHPQFQLSAVNNQNVNITTSVMESKMIDLGVEPSEVNVKAAEFLAERGVQPTPERLNIITKIASYFPTLPASAALFAAANNIAPTRSNISALAEWLAGDDLLGEETQSLKQDVTDILKQASAEIKENIQLPLNTGADGKALQTNITQQLSPQAVQTFTDNFVGQVIRNPEFPTQTIALPTLANFAEGLANMSQAEAKEAITNFLNEFPSLSGEERAALTEILNNAYESSVGKTENANKDISGEQNVLSGEKSSGEPQQANANQNLQMPQSQNDAQQTSSSAQQIKLTQNDALQTQQTTNDAPQTQQTINDTQQIQQTSSSTQQIKLTQNDAPQTHHTINDAQQNQQTTNDSPQMQRTTNDVPQTQQTTNDSPQTQQTTNDSTQTQQTTNNLQQAQQPEAHVTDPQSSSQQYRAANPTNAAAQLNIDNNAQNVAVNVNEQAQLNFTENTGAMPSELNVTNNTQMQQMPQITISDAQTNEPIAEQIENVNPNNGNVIKDEQTSTNTTTVNTSQTEIKTEAQKVLQQIEKMVVSMKNENPTDAEALKETVKTQQRTADNIKEGMARIAGENSAPAQKAGEMATRIQLGNQLDNFYYCQVPFKLGDNQNTAELYVFNRKKSESASERVNTTILIALETQRMGRVETVLRAEENNLNLEFRVESGKIQKYLEKETAELKKHLEESSFQVLGIKVVRIDVPATPLNVDQLVGEKENFELRTIDISV